MERRSYRERTVTRLARFVPHLRGTARATVRPDVVAGLTVAALAVPQGLAYALVAGVPPEMGLYAAAIPTLLAALFGSSPYLVTGPTNPIALVVGVSIVAPALAEGRPVPVDDVLATGLLAGLMLAGFGLVGLGRASRFLSDSVLAGFATGAGILIALRQIPALAESAAPTGAGSPLAPAVWWLLLDAVRALADAEPRSIGLALGVPAAVLLLRRVDARIPAALLALGGATFVARALGWDSGPDALATIGSIPASFAQFGLPSFDAPGRIAAPALAVAMLATLQSVAAARTLRPPDGVRLDPDRELVSQGAANLAASLSGALPTSGSLTRSALARSAGGRSRLAPAVSGLAIAALLPLFGPALEQVPLAALVGLVVMSGLDLVNARGIRRAATTPGDAAVLIVTLAATLWIDLLQALYAGLFLSLALLVRRAGRLQMVELVRAGAERFREIPVDEKTGDTPAVLLHLEGDLNFAVAEELADRLLEIGRRGPRVVVLRLKRARHLDATVLESLRHTAEELKRRGTLMVVCGLTDELAHLLEATELSRVLGPEGLLRAGPRLFEGFERALRRSREFLHPLADDEIFRSEGTVGWMYEI
jgi:SulP family sulfate permease